MDKSTTETLILIKCRIEEQQRSINSLEEKLTLLASILGYEFRPQHTPSRNWKIWNTKDAGAWGSK